MVKNSMATLQDAIKVDTNLIENNHQTYTNYLELIETVKKGCDRIVQNMSE